MRMQEFNCREQLAAAHHRLHSIEQWPEGIRREAALSAIESTLDSLSRHPAMSDTSFACILCQSKRSNVTVLEPADAARHRVELEDRDQQELAS